MSKLSAPERRRFRTRNRLRSAERPRLTVHRSLRHIYAQIIDDGVGATLAASSSLALKAEGSKSEVAKQVGADIAQKALAYGVTQVVFDRGAFKYHGRVKALAEAAREAGLSF